MINPTTRNKNHDDQEDKGWKQNKESEKYSSINQDDDATAINGIDSNLAAPRR